MIAPIKGELNYEKILNREIIERIGYDVSISELEETSKQRFVFDTYAIQEMINISKDSNKVRFIISASSQNEKSKNEGVNWLDTKRVKRPSLTLRYIKKRRNAPSKVTNLRSSIEDGIVRLDWDAPKDDGFSGVIVVKNPFKVPCSPYDGQKLYGGSDTYTYDNFGDREIHKYYAVFSYDDVPNFSEAEFLEINK